MHNPTSNLTTAANNLPPRGRAVDFFCGAGGTTIGMSSVYNVVAAVNHDPEAIACHKANHPTTSTYNDDVRKVDERELAQKYGPVDAVFWSAECTHFSNAKGGQPRDADSRMLNDELYRFVHALQPTRIYVENVREFLTWGPLTEQNGKLMPCPDQQGIDYNRWVRTIKRMGYDYDYRILNSADYGSHTSRERYFGIFAKRGTPIIWPEQTHSRDPAASTLFDGTVDRWRPAREILDLDDHGESLFTRKRPLVPATFARIAFGINRFVTDPIAKEQLQLLVNHHASSKGRASTGKTPPSITKDHVTLTKAQWIDKQYGSGPHNVAGLDMPVPTITTNPKLKLVTVQFISKQWSGASNVSSINHPLPTIATQCGHQLVTAGQHEDGFWDIRMRGLSVQELLLAQGFPLDYKLPSGVTLSKKFIGNSVPPHMARALAKAQHNLPYSGHLVHTPLQQNIGAAA